MTTTPFGVAVDPDVNCTNAMSEAAGVASAASAGPASASNGTTTARSAQVARSDSMCGSSLDDVMTPRGAARAEHAAGGVEVRRQIARRRRRIERRRDEARDRRAEERRQKRFRVADDDRDEIAAAQAERAERPGDAERRRVDVGV